MVQTKDRQESGGPQRNLFPGGSSLIDKKNGHDPKLEDLNKGTPSVFHEKVKKSYLGCLKDHLETAFCTDSHHKYLK